MGYAVKVTPGKPVTQQDLDEFLATVPERKSCPTHIREGDIWINGSYSLSGHLYRAFTERMIRWFWKVKRNKLHADWNYL